jgi:tRNA pseudouridine65 synthase
MQIKASLAFVCPNPLINEKNILKISLNDAMARINANRISDLPTIAALLKTERFKLQTNEVEILYQDEYCVATNKPPGIMVHRTSLSNDTDFLLQRVRDTTKKKVYPVHRLDRPTSGIVVFAFDKDAASEFFRIFRERGVKKNYLAVTRGHTDDNGKIDKALKSEKGNMQDALTLYETLAKTELPIPVRPYQTSRYSLVKIDLKTGRNHQIRRHFSSISHPVIGDTQHGDGKHNRMFQTEFGSHRLLLAATELAFEHPFTQKHITIKAPLDKQFKNLLKEINLLPKLSLT